MNEEEFVKAITMAFSRDGDLRSLGYELLRSSDLTGYQRKEMNVINYQIQWLFYPDGDPLFWSKDENARFRANDWREFDEIEKKWKRNGLTR